MILPRLAPPVRQIANQKFSQPPDNNRLEVFMPALQKLFGTDPVSGETVFEWVLIECAIPYPNDPQRYLGPVTCDSGCYVFSGFSRAACIAACRR